MHAASEKYTCRFWQISWKVIKSYCQLPKNAHAACDNSTFSSWHIHILLLTNHKAASKISTCIFWKITCSFRQLDMQTQTNPHAGMQHLTNPYAAEYLIVQDSKQAWQKRRRIRRTSPNFNYICSVFTRPIESSTLKEYFPHFYK